MDFFNAKHRALLKYSSIDLQEAFDWINYNAIQDCERKELRYTPNSFSVEEVNPIHLYVYSFVALELINLHAIEYYILIFLLELEYIILSAIELYLTISIIVIPFSTHQTGSQFNLNYLAKLNVWNKIYLPVSGLELQIISS